MSAYRTNAEMWQTPFTAETCPSASTPEGKQGELFFPTIGFNGYVFVYAYAPSGCSSPDNRLYMLNALNGKVIDSLPLQGPNLSGSWHPKQFDHVFPGENGVAFLDGTNVRYATFDTNNTPGIGDDELTEGTNTAIDLASSSGQFILHASGNGAGYVYAILSNGANSDANNLNASCTGSVELARATPASGSTPGRSTVPVSTCSFVPDSVAISPDNGVVVLGAQPGTSGAYDDMLVKYSVSDAVVYNKDLNNMSGDGFATVRRTSQPAVDNNGVAILVSTADVTQYSNSDRYVVVRKVDATGTMSIVYASSDDYTMDPNGQDKFGAGTKVDLQGGKAYFVSCKLEWYANFCGAANNTYVTVLDLVNVIGDRYPRSEPLTSYDYEEIDMDGDKLNMFHENQQGTSDYSQDFDDDGIDDNKESEWYSDKIVTYCNTDTQNNPINCAAPNPLQKDLFVQIDWTKDNNYSTQPTPDQLMPVVEAFREFGIETHFDVGHNIGSALSVGVDDDIKDFGGGNQVPYRGDTVDLNEFSLDITDYKKGDTQNNLTSNFSDKRRGVWRYMLFSRFIPDDDPNSIKLGTAIGGDDDMLIAYESVGIVAPNDFDVRLSKAVMHEMGHSLCLTPIARYEFQDSTCIYSKVDGATSVTHSMTENGTGYYGIMNYNIGTNTSPLSSVSYSEGLYNDDHNDWVAVKKGMKDFSLPKLKFELDFTTTGLDTVDCNEEEHMVLCF
ncbi:hypothetical protein JNJ66_06370 [Candidatus Saccharibacteria bacterium]|nr:hypothetical protein [Candidatus Saccharibacteria bacterium]